MLRTIVSALSASRAQLLQKAFGNSAETTRPLHCSAALSILDKQSRDRKSLHQAKEVQAEKAATVKKSEDGDLVGLTSRAMLTPNASTMSMLVDGVPYSELPVVHIKSTLNNTIASLTDHTGTRSYSLRSCGTEGFHNAKKGTNIAAQAVGLSVAQRAQDADVQTVRVKVKGLGPGRLACIKGLQMGGLRIVSITDNTAIKINAGRSRKAKRL